MGRGSRSGGAAGTFLTSINGSEGPVHGFAKKIGERPSTLGKSKRLRMHWAVARGPVQRQEVTSRTKVGVPPALRLADGHPGVSQVRRVMRACLVSESVGTFYAYPTPPASAGANASQAGPLHGDRTKRQRRGLCAKGASISPVVLKSAKEAIANTKIYSFKTDVFVAVVAVAVRDSPNVCGVPSLPTGDPVVLGPALVNLKTTAVTPSTSCTDHQARPFPASNDNDRVG